MWIGGRGARPTWWPADHPWPPPGASRPSRRFLLRFGLTFSLSLLTMGGILAGGVWAALVALGAISASWELRVAALAILVGGIGCFLMLGRAMRRRMAPIAALIEAAAQIERGDYSARVPERGGRERALARTFNTMSERLGAIDSQRRSFLADVPRAAHAARDHARPARGDDRRDPPETTSTSGRSSSMPRRSNASSPTSPPSRSPRRAACR